MPLPYTSATTTRGANRAQSFRLQHFQVPPLDIDRQEIDRRARRYMLDEDVAQRDHRHGNLVDQAERGLVACACRRLVERVEKGLVELEIGRLAALGSDADANVGIGATEIAERLHRTRQRVDVYAAPTARMKKGGIGIPPRVMR